MKPNQPRQGFLLIVLAAFLTGCPGGSSGEKEKVYGTAVDPSTYFSPTSPSGSTKSKEIRLAECMTEKGAVIYGSRGCSITVKQLNLFGNASRYLDYVDCNDNRDRCAKNSIRYYPTWICKGRRITGSYPLDALADFTGCD